MLIEVKDLSFYYKFKQYCFKDLGFSLDNGENLAVLGLNGQGKSTLLYNLMGVLKPVYGKVKLNSSFAYLPQNFVLAFDYSVLDVVLMGRAGEISFFKTPSNEDRKIAEHSLEMLEISHLKEKNFNSLSGGQKQLVLFARALAKNSQILILDEPASALDLKNQDRVLSLIKRLNREFGLSVVFSTHQPNHAFAIADKTLILYDDLSYKFGDTMQILDEKNQEKLYKIQIKNINLACENSDIVSSVAIFNSQI